MIRGALYQLVLQYTWPQDDPAQVLLAQQRMMTLIASLIECEDTIPAIACGYNFEFSDAGWAKVMPDNQGDYAPGEGWVGTFVDTNSRSAVYIQHFLSGVNTITHIELTLSSEVDGHGANDSVELFYHDTGGYHAISLGGVTAGTRVYTWDGSLSNIDELRIATNSGDVDNLTLITNAQYRGLSDSGCG